MIYSRQSELAFEVRALAFQRAVANAILHVVTLHVCYDVMYVFYVMLCMLCYALFYVCNIFALYAKRSR